MYYSKCSTYSSLSLKFLLDEANFYGCFSFYENLAGEQESISPWLFEKNWFYYPQSALPAQIPDQSVLGPGGRGEGGLEETQNIMMVFHSLGIIRHCHLTSLRSAGGSNST